MSDYDQLLASCLCAFEGNIKQTVGWAQPLPLTREDCEALFNLPEARPHGREYLVGRYGLLLRDHGWHYHNAKPFEVFCADQLRPPGFW
jgi:hypothetical protein